MSSGRRNSRRCPVQVYLDIESNPDAGFVYLIGMITVANGTETQSSFWADHKDQEVDIFEQFVAEVTRHADFLVFCYGSYERAFITRMRKVAKAEEAGRQNPECVSQCPYASVLPGVLSNVLEWTQRHRSLCRLDVDGPRGLRAAEYRVENPVGSDPA